MSSVSFPSHTVDLTETYLIYYCRSSVIIYEDEDTLSCSFCRFKVREMSFKLDCGVDTLIVFKNLFLK